MDTEGWELLKRAFSLVIAAGPEGAETALLAACAGDKGMLLELRPLVDEHFHQARSAASDSAATTSLGGLIADRFRVLARLGGGTFGEVYHVADQVRGGQQLAVKVLRSSDPLALQYFKREFRSHVDVYHPNIVALHELIFHAGRWMFSMEFVDGVDLLRFLEACPGDRQATLRSIFAQLAEGVHDLHRRNLLHRDLKPANVLVTADGRVVICDFGLVRVFGDPADTAMTFAGTPDYMSPEQARGASLGEPSDWYAVGVMLYQVLTGCLPFQGNSFEVLHRKQGEVPAPPAEVAAAPLDLSDLCCRLLDRDPARRATYSDVVRLLRPASAATLRATASSPFLGREDAIKRLFDAYDLAVERPVVLHLCGPSGIGKTALLRELQQRLSARGALVLAGRCFEGETVPYQAIDDLIDEIARHLSRLSPGSVPRFLPRHFPVLVKMFPVLSRFMPRQTTRVVAVDATELRTRGLAALREMLGRLSEAYRLVLVVDDLQWGDVDGCAALDEFVSSRDAPPILVVLAYRPENSGALPWLAALRNEHAQPSGRAMLFLDLEPLNASAAATLAETLFQGDADFALCRQVGEEAGGNPFLIQEMARWMHAGADLAASPGSFRFADVVRIRIATLTPESRRFLERLAVAAQPLPVSLLWRIEGAPSPHSIPSDVLADHFVRVAREREEVEIYHDRVRAAIVDSIPPDLLTARHRELALALVPSAMSDAERIAVHFEHAGEPASCALYALQAGRRAVDVLAFDRASRFFQMALATGALDDAERRSVHRQCADTLASAGRGPDAADHYLASCRDAPIDQQLEANLRAAEQLLYSGHVDRGLAIFASLLAQIGVRLPASGSRMPFGLLLRRLQLRLRGVRWRSTAAADIPPSVLLKIDTCASVATGLSLVDLARGAALQSTSLLLALRAGEESRIARALTMEAAYSSTVGFSAKPRVERLLAVAGKLAKSTGDRKAIGLSAVMGAACAWNAGQWEECSRLAAAAREGLRERVEHVMWERDTASIFELDGLRWAGRWARMKALLPELLGDARRRGDLYAQAILEMHAGSCARLAEDEPLAARAGLRILSLWSTSGFHVEHLVETHNQVEIALYLGEDSEAFALLEDRWTPLRRSLLLRVQNFNIQMRSLRARAALAAATHVIDRTALLRIAASECRVICRQRAPWGDALAALVEGGVHAGSGRREPAIRAFQRAEAAAMEAGMILHAAAARRAWGVLLGEGGRECVETADREMRGEGVIRPEILARVMTPGVHELRNYMQGPMRN